ncbi:helix-turn-helix domain-containing protein [Mumia sp. DW29H23]|uniref:helix-turn-helix domain-containing protein n=1 Tax=Mumia sp. DW29H23 TaxID=3421241 RepID=UPI003D68CAFD
MPPTPPPAISPKVATAKAVTVELARRGLSQSWLANQISMSENTLSARMTGRKAFDVAELDLIATAFGLSIFEFMRIAEDEATRSAA